MLLTATELSDTRLDSVKAPIWRQPGELQPQGVFFEVQKGPCGHETANTGLLYAKKKKVLFLRYKKGPCGHDTVNTGLLDVQTIIR